MHSVLQHVHEFQYGHAIKNSQYRNLKCLDRRNWYRNWKCLNMWNSIERATNATILGARRPQWFSRNWYAKNNILLKTAKEYYMHDLLTLVIGPKFSNVNNLYRYGYINKQQKVDYQSVMFRKKIDSYLRKYKASKELLEYLSGKTKIHNKKLNIHL